MEEYNSVKRVAIIDMTVATTKLYIMIIVALVIYKSSRTVNNVRDPYLEQDVSLLMYLRNQDFVYRTESS